MKKIQCMLLLAGSILIALAGCGGGGSGGSSGGDDNGSSDTAAPQILATNPTHQSTGVETNQSITVKFTEPIDVATMNENTFLLTSGGSAVSGFIAYDADSRTAIFDGPLAAGNTYTATITTGVRDLAGNRLAANYVWSFSTGTGTDITAPTVRFTVPAGGATGVALNTALSATFSESIDPGTINAQTITLQQGGTTVAGTLTTVGSTVTLRPAADLAADTPYTATITTGIEDLSGNNLAANYSWSFTTTSGIDMTPPQVLSVSPPDGAANVPLDAVIVVNYNEPITPFEFGLLDGRPVTVAFNNTYTQVTLTPTAPLTPGLTYSASVQSKDAAGNEMPQAFEWQFSTVP